MSGQSDFKPVRRHKADVDEWKILRKLKRGPCRVGLCGPTGWRIELHHLVGRDLGGDDVPDNLIPVCLGCHALVEERRHVACELLRASLTLREFAYITTKKGVRYLNLYYPRRSAEDVGTAA